MASAGYPDCPRNNYVLKVKIMRHQIVWYGVYCNKYKKEIKDLPWRLLSTTYERAFPAGMVLWSNMTWNDVFVALDALLALPILAAAIVLVWNAANSAESFSRSERPEKGLGRSGRVVFGEVEVSAQSPYK